MTTKVTKESLAERIQHLEDLGSMISLNEEYQLEAYRKLLVYVQNEESTDAVSEDFDV